ncbi:hypothetical protein GTPT_0115 [Tatumella ptyseos ATCC 33301]|uniref:HTH lacI-type domain-containing protein n=2 Tax=Tatumella ptyseos TaxID=82987 RepID=A0A085JPZ6_9GAMM|nr:hypothetical protein GTPT_0115 [Tatumella ptyseos ATCC 33301]SQK72176.1 DNA-binding transcriptional regulator GalS [Tatumella ptyseos]
MFARLAGVSMMTVSRVMNNSVSVRADTRDRVLQVLLAKGIRIPQDVARAAASAFIARSCSAIPPEEG